MKSVDPKSNVSHYRTSCVTPQDMLTWRLGVLTLVQQTVPVSLHVCLVPWVVMSCCCLEVMLASLSPHRMHQHSSVGHVPVLFLFPCALPSCQGIKFRCEIRIKSVPSLIIKKPDSRSPGQCSWLRGFHHKILAIHVFSLKKTHPPKKEVQLFNYLERFYHDWKLWDMISKVASVSGR